MILKNAIVDNSIFSALEQENIKSYMMGAFPWFLGDGHEKTADPNQYSYSKDVFEYMQLCHGFVHDSEITSDHHALTDVMEDMIRSKYSFLGKLTRIKANLQSKVYEPNINAYNTPHVDADLEHWVVLYYVIDSDGDTFIFDNDLTIKQRISPQQGQTVIFDGSSLHAGMHPRLADYRIVINFNFLKQ
jgi:hypothetical protein